MREVNIQHYPGSISDCGHVKFNSDLSLALLNIYAGSVVVSTSKLTLQ